MRKLLLILLLISFKSFSQTLETDRLALIAFYNSTAAGGWYYKTNWTVPGTPGDNPCGWYGVTCEGGRVTGLDLHDNNLGGMIPVEIGNLSALKSLDFSFTGEAPFPDTQGVTGKIPAEIGNLTNLEYLNLSGLYLYGTIPTTIGNLVNLKTLDLHFVGVDAGFDPYGDLSGGIPTEIGNLTKLQHLDLMGHNFTGILPAQLGNLTNLEYLDLSYNDFSGSLPSSLGNLVKLKRLYLSYFGYLRSHENGLITGPIPATFTNLTALEVLGMENQSLTGPIPDLSGIPVSAHVNIDGNKLNFDGMESNISRLDYYGNQQKFQLYAIGPLGGGAIGFLDASSAGGTKANNTYKWYQNGTLFNTTVGVDFISVSDGIYRVEVTNSVVPGLKLVSENVTVARLPVTLVSFEGKSETNQTKLTWKTTSETNNKGFEIERSADARTFEKIGFVDGSGDTKENQFYHFTDLNPFAKSYYRLKQLDYDGQFEYSKVISVKSEAAIIKVYPNPAQEYLIVSGISEKQPFSIIDQNGRVVMERLVVDKEQVNIRNLGAGRYVVKVGGESSRLLIHR